MNKKIYLFILFIFSFVFMSKNVFAACTDVYNSFPYPTEEQCSRFSEDNFKCKGNGYSGGMVSKLVCEKSNECIDGFTNNNGVCVQNTDNDNNNNNNNNSSITNSNETNSTHKIPCNTYTTEQQCGTIGKCEWNKVEKTCQEVYIAEMPCNEESIKIALRFFGYLLMIAKVAIPLIIIIMGTIDLFKSVTDKDEKSFGKQVKILLMRIVAGVFVFFIPTIIYALFSISSDLNIVEDNKYQTCIDCLLKPTICTTSNN